MVWNDAMDYIAYFTTVVINEAIETANLPNVWKTSTVTPIPKIRNTSIAGEFRPINSLPVDAKMIESIIKEQLISYLEENNIIYKNQSAFRKHHSCETTINYVTNEWMVAKDNGLSTIAVFLDFKRAFETVDRTQMILKLEKYGIKNDELNFFKNYLSARKQRTKFKNSTSREEEVPIGLPQGTALSVVLFIMYINDLAKIPIHCKIVLFADDTVVYIQAKDINDAIMKINEDLERIYQWLNEFINGKENQIYDYKHW